MTVQEFIKNQKEYCKETGAPFFMPSDGICWACGGNIVLKLIADGETGKSLVTGCPICHRTYCD